MAGIGHNRCFLPASYGFLQGVWKLFQVGDEIVRALVDVSFTVGKGEFVALMGPSGSGKSTMLYLLGGLWPSQGGVYVWAYRTMSERWAFLGGFLSWIPVILAGTLRSRSTSAPTALLIQGVITSVAIVILYSQQSLTTMFLCLQGVSTRGSR